MTNRFDFIGNLFDNNNSNASKAQKRRRGRQCRIEELENREMLSVTPWSLVDYDDTYTLASKPNETELVFQNVIDSVAAEMIQDGMPVLAPLAALDTGLGNAIVVDNVTQNGSSFNNLVNRTSVTVYSAGWMTRGRFEGSFSGTIQKGEMKWANSTVGKILDPAYLVGIDANTSLSIAQNALDFAWGSTINSVLESIGLIKRTPDTVSGTLSGTIALTNRAEGKLTNTANIKQAYVAGYGNDGGVVWTGTLEHNGNTIGVAVVDANGRLVNNGTTVPVGGKRATIELAFVSGDEYGVGELDNAAGANIGIVFVGYNGKLNNTGAYIEIASLDGGHVDNYARIEYLTYTNGTYIPSGDASIGTLTISSDSTGINGKDKNFGNDWGQVDKLLFDSNGRGSITVNASPTNTISKFKATHVDLTNGNIVLNLNTDQNLKGTALINYFINNYANKGFKIADLFVAGADVYGMNSLKSFTVTDGSESFAILVNGANSNGWTFNKTNGTMSLTGASTTTNRIRTLVVTSQSDLATDTGSLRYAIANANAGDTITFATSLAGKPITLNSELVITKNITIDATGMGITIANGKTTAASNTRVFNIGVGTTVSLKGLTIKGGKTTTSGGAIVNAGTLTLTDCTITGSTTTANGGGIYNIGTLTVTNCTISGNETTGSSSCGGGIFNAGITTVSNCIIFDNHTIYFGGGMYNSGTMTVKDSTISKNYTDNKSNDSLYYGGGIFNTQGTLTVSCSEITGNEARRGGGIGNRDAGTLNVSNSVIAGNWAAERGGGIWSNFMTTATNCTIAGNWAGTAGGGIYAPDATKTTLYNTILAGNRISVTGGSSASNYSNDTKITGSNNLYDTGNPPNIFVRMPDLARGNYGDRTGLNYKEADWDLRLKSNATSAINKGSNTYATAYDLDGKARIISSTVDIGAYEDGTQPLNQPLNQPHFSIADTTINSISLAWSTVSNASGYQIRYRQTGSTGAWTTVTVSGGSTSTRVFTGLPANTSYDFQICSTHSGGNSDWSLTPVTAMTKVKLGTPTLGTVTATPNEINKISVAWSAVANVNGYTIQYATNSAFTANMKTITVTNGATTSTTISDLNANTTYYIRIKALGAGNSWDADYSATKSFNRLTTPTLGTVSGIHHNEISVAWGAVSNASGYTIQYATNSAFTTGVGTKTITGGTITSTTITGLNATTTYYVRIMATGTGTYCNSDYSASKSATTKTKLATPTLGTVAGAHHNETSVAWGAVSNASGYTIQYATNSAFTTGVGTKTVTGQATTSTTITGLSANTTYYVRVVAKGAGTYCDSDPSASKSAKTKTKLATPTLGTVAGTHHNEISVAWGTVSNASGYTIQYATNSTFTTGVGTKTVTGGSTTSTTITGLNATTTYYVRVMATGTDNYCDSDYSTSKSATTKTKLATPTFNVTPTSSGINVTWSAVPNASSYELQYATNSAFTTGVVTKTVNSPAMSTDITGLNASTTYYIRMRAIGTGNYCESDYSAAKSVLTMPATPLTFHGSVDEDKMVTLTWGTQASLTGYTLEYRVSGAPGWTLHSNPDKNATSATISGLTQNTLYEFQLTAVNASGSATATILVTINPDAVVIEDFTSLSQTVNSVTLAWGTETHVDSYVLKYREFGVSGWNTATAPAPSALNATIPGLAPNTKYEIELTGTNVSGSGVVSVFATTLCNAPTGLTGAPTATSIALSWTAPTGGATSYRVERSANGTSGWTAIYTGSTTSYTDDSCTPNTKYYYRVYGVNSAGADSAPAETGNYTTLCNAPTNLTGTSTATSIALSWTAPTGGGAISYRVERSANGTSGWTQIGGTITGTTYTESLLLPNTTYYFRICAVNSEGVPSEPIMISFTTLCNVPTDLTGTPTATSIALSWTAPTGGATSYRVERSANGSSGWAAIYTGNTTSYTDDSCDSSTIYYYRVHAINSAGADSATATTGNYTTLDNAPTGLSGTSTAASITLSWTAPTGGATSYRLERSTNGTSGWSQIGGSLFDTFYTDNDSLNPNTAYYYRVSSVNSDGIASAPAPVLEVKTLLLTPHDLRSTDTTKNSVSLEWSPVTGATGYVIEWRKSDGSTSWSNINVIVTGTTAVVGNLAANREYEFRIRAINDGNESIWSMAVSEMTDKTALPPPTLGSVTSTGNNSINVTWSAVGNAIGYRVEYATDDEFINIVGTKLIDSQSTTSTDITAGIMANTTYYTRVIATGTGDYIDSDCSAQKSATTLCNAPTVLISSSQTTTSIDLVWNTSVGGAESYKLEFSLTGTDGTWEQIGGALMDTFYTHGDSLVPNKSYYYRVSAVNASGISVPTSVLEIQTSPIILDAPTVTTTSKNSTSVTATWNAVDNASGYVIECATNEEFTVIVGTKNVSGDVRTVDFIGLTTLTPYFVRVMAINPGAAYNNSGWSYSDATIPGKEALTAPTSVAVTATSSSTINVLWSAVENASGYWIECATDVDFEYVIDQISVDSSTISMPITRLDANTTYYVRVMAIGIGDYGDSDWSDEMSLTTLLSLPTGCQSHAPTSNSIILAWNFMDSVTGYEVQYRQSSSSVGTWSTKNISIMGIMAVISNLEQGTEYEFQVRAKNSNNYSAWSASIFETTPAPDAQLLDSPENVTATSKNDTTIIVAWEAVANASGYRIQCATDPMFTQIVETKDVSNSVRTIDLTDLTTDTTYYIRVMATGTGEYSNSDWSDEMSLTTLLKTPTNFQGIVPTGNSIILAWNIVTDATSYEIQYRPSSDETWTTENVTIMGVMAIVSDLTVGTEYEFQVRGKNSDNYSAWSASTFAIIPDPMAEPLDLPESVTVASKNTTTITVTWEAVANASGYRIQCATDPMFTQIIETKNVSSSEKTVDFADLTTGNEYYVRVMALGTGGYNNSEWSDIDSAIPSLPPNAQLATPPGVKMDENTAKTLNVSWDTVPNAEGYIIEWSLTENFAKVIDTLTIVGNTTSCVIPDLEAETGYFVRVMAITTADGFEESDWSTPIRFETNTTIVVPPTIPENFRGTAQTEDSVTLQWNTQLNLTAYTLQYRVSGTETQWTPFPAPATNASSATVTDLAANTEYEFRLRAINGGGSSEFTITVATTGKFKLTASTLGNVVALDSNTISVEWSAATNASGYMVQYAIDQFFTDALTVSVTGTSTTLTGLMANKTYFVRVMAIGDGVYGNSEWSGSIPAMTHDEPLITQSIFRSIDKTSNSVSLVWNIVPGAIGYEIRYRTVSDAGFGEWSSENENVTFSGTTAKVGKLDGSTTYEFQMRSKGSGSVISGWSAGIEETTYAEPKIVTDISLINKNLSTVKGVKVGKSTSKPTQTSLSFTWNPATTFSADEMTFEVHAPKPKGWAKSATAPCVAAASITSEELATILGGTTVTKESGDCTLTFAKKVNGGIEIKVSGLAAGMKYTMRMQSADGHTGRYSKITKVSASTAKYSAPKSAGKATASLGTVTFSWKQSAVTPASMNSGAKREYMVGIWIGKEFIAFGSGDGEHSRIVNGSTITITVTGRTAVVTGLASQKYTFGVQESVTAGDDIAKSAIAKISASPTKYNAPKVTKPTAGATTLTWTPVRTATGDQTITYLVGVYDSNTREFKVTPAVVETEEHVAINISALGVGKIGVQELLWEDGNLIAKSAIKVVTVKAV